MHASESATRVSEDRVLADIDRSLPAVYDYLLHRCGGRALAEDLTSETVLAAVDHVRNGHIDTIEIGYLIGIARHKLVDHWRRQEREQRHMLVGRTITFIGTATDGVGGALLNTDDQFRSALERVVERTTAALA